MPQAATNPVRRTLFALTILSALSTLTACGGGGDDSTNTNAQPLATLDGSMPLVIGHRGLPGLYPEETLPSYEGAVDAGADSLEEDLHLTKDCVLVARHNPWLSDNTNIAEIAATNPDGGGTQAHRARRPRQREVLTSPRYGGPAQYLSDLTDPSRSEIGAQVAGRRRRGPHRRLVDHRLHRRRAEGVDRRDHLRRRGAAPERATTASTRSSPCRRSSISPRPRAALTGRDHHRLSGSEEPVLEQRPGDRQRLRHGQPTRSRTRSSS